MDIKYVVLGINVIVFGALLAVYSYLVGSPQLLGVSSSIILVGLVLLVLGYSYVEPTTSLLIDYSRDVSRFASLLLEDLRLSNVLPSTYVDGGKVYLVLSAAPPSSIRDLSPGLNVVGGEPVLLIPLNAMFEGGVATSLYEVESRLRERLVGEYGLCSAIELGGGDEALSVRLVGLDTRLLGGELAPLNPIDTMVITTLSGVMGKGLQFIRRVLEGSEYRAEFRVVG